ncbi:DUF2283 domain-containing protein [bacterium]|nr:DUF2283 domain-containing protein [bacterium]
MRFHYDKTQDVLYIKFNENPYYESQELQEGIIFDYDKNKKIIGIEIFDVSQKFPIEFKKSILKQKLPLFLTINPGLKKRK